MVRNIVHISYHIIVVLLSAAIALSLPFMVSFLAKNLLASWAFIQNEKIFLVALELCTAAMLILLFSNVRRGWEARKLARVAASAGLVLATPFKGALARKQIKKLKAKLGYEREIMVIGSTGLRTFAEPEGELHQVVQECREARIMLLNPDGEGAIARAKSIPDPEITPEIIRDQVVRSIDFLKGLKAGQKNIRLKLYPDMPFLKLAILGDYAFLRHYHAGLTSGTCPNTRSKATAPAGASFFPSTGISFRGGMIRTSPNTTWIRTNLSFVTNRGVS